MSRLDRADGHHGAARLRRIQVILAYRYKVNYRIGGGIAADVYLTDDRTTGKTVAIKVYSGVSAAGIGAERFVREVRMTAALDHPNILEVLESGVDAGLLYYVMPFAESGTLAELMAAEKRMSLRRVCRILSELADALAFAHGRGIVHRDIKPENVMLFDGQAKLADFGIAKPMQGGVTLSVAGVPLGTPDFMAPEQVLSRPVDGRADIYALGALAYEMFTGEPLFPCRNTMQTMAAHVSDTPPELAEKRPDLPVALTEAVKKCLAKETAKRFQNMEDLRRVIEEVDKRASRRSSDTRFLPLIRPHVNPA